MSGTSLIAPQSRPRPPAGQADRPGVCRLHRRRRPGTLRQNRRSPMKCVFIQLRCRPGRTYDVADAIYDREFASELYSTSGEYDLIMKVYIPDEDDIGHFVNEKLRDIPDIDRSLTTLTFKAF
jgi:DNA-binding Lrp family transcriptional regulator